MNTLTESLPAHHAESALGKGILAGLAGGIVFGILMQMMGLMPMIASMVGSESVVVGWMIHLMISAIFGLFYGLFAYKISTKWALAGLVYGVILWVAGPLIIMPMMMGMAPFMFTSTTWMSLMGHMVFGLVTAFTFLRLRG